MLGVRRAEGQDPEPAAALVSKTSRDGASAVYSNSNALPPRIDALDNVQSSTLSGINTHLPKTIEKIRYETALREHEQIFGKGSAAILVWPDHYLSYERLGGKTSFEEQVLKDTLRSEGARVIIDGSTLVHPLEDAVSTVRATTALLGPASFPIVKGSPEFPPVIAVVGFDSARPRSLAQKSLAGITCPTFMFTQLLSREDLHTFVRFHESGHVFQHFSGRVLPDDIETPYERCRIEAEADVFAALWWIKTHSGDRSVPSFFSHLRTSNFIECAASGNERLTLQYATILPLQSAIERGAALWESGELDEMSSDEVYYLARSIVAHVLPTERQLTATIRELHDALTPYWKEPFHRRTASIRESLAKKDTPKSVEAVVEMYLDSVDFFTDPSHVVRSHPHLADLPAADQAREIWLQELLDDLAFSDAPALVIDRYELDLSSSALALWRLSVTSSRGEEIKEYIKYSGAPNEYFVPSEIKSRMLSDVKKSAIEALNKGNNDQK